MSISLMALDNALVQIEAVLPRLPHAYYRLVLVVGGPATGKTRLLRALADKYPYPLLNVNLEISQLLLEHTVAERPRLVPDLLRQFVKATGSQLVLLDNTELLFYAAIGLAPLAILQSLSRNVTLVAAWRGSYANGQLTYAEPWHAEYRSYRLTPQDAVVVPMQRDQ